MQPVAGLTAALECALTTLGRLRNAAVSIVRESATNCARTIEIIFLMLLICLWENNRHLKYRTPPKRKHLSIHSLENHIYLINQQIKTQYISYIFVLWLNSK